MKKTLKVVVCIWKAMASRRHRMVGAKLHLEASIGWAVEATTCHSSKRTKYSRILQKEKHTLQCFNN